MSTFPQKRGQNVKVLKQSVYPLKRLKAIAVKSRRQAVAPPHTSHHPLACTGRPGPPCERSPIYSFLLESLAFSKTSDI